MKKLIAILFILIALLLTSCGGADDAPSVTDSTTVTSSTSEVTTAEATTEATTAEPPIVLEPLDSPRRFVTVGGAYTQSVCVSDDFVFISHSASFGADKNDYVLRKYDRFTGELIAEGTARLNHANGMAYNSRTDEIVVVALDGDASSTATVGEQDYSLFFVDPDTLDVKRTVSLLELIRNILPESVGIGGVAYDERADEYYVLTRYPNRYIVRLSSEFKHIWDFPIKDDLSGTRGDICCDGEYVYTVLWLDPSTENVVDIYTKDGDFVRRREVNGLTHIEGIDRRNGRFYLCFIDFNVSPAAAVVCEMDELENVK